MERLYDLYLQDELRQRVVESMKSIIVALPAFNGRSSSSGVVDEDEIRGHNLVKQVVSFWMARLLAKITKVNTLITMCTQTQALKAAIHNPMTIHSSLSGQRSKQSCNH